MRNLLFRPEPGDRLGPLGLFLCPQRSHRRCVLRGHRLQLRGVKVGVSRLHELFFQRVALLLGIVAFVPVIAVSVRQELRVRRHHDSDAATDRHPDPEQRMRPLSGILAVVGVIHAPESDLLGPEIHRQPHHRGGLRPEVIRPLLLDP